MSVAEILYPEMRDDCFYSPSNYQPIINHFGVVVVQVDDDDYDGDTRVLYRDGDKIGWLQFGWGSCSGCDALQGCDTIEEIDNLIEELRSSIRWFDSVGEALRFFKVHDWRGDYSCHEERQNDFVNKAITYLTYEES